MTFEENFVYLESKKRYIAPTENPLDVLVAEGTTKLAKEIYESDLKFPNIFSDNTIENCRRISLTTSCMDRNEFLLKSLESWIRFPFREIIIVDWSSKKPIIDSIKEYFGENFLSTLKVPIKIKRIENQKFYDHSKVRNTKLDLCESDWILCIDSDIILNSHFGSFFVLSDPKRFYTNFSKKSDKGLYGTAIFSKYLLEQVGRFDESLKYWGNEDGDFYERAIDKGFKLCDIRSLSMIHQEHSDELRSKNTPYESIWRSLSENNYKIAKKKSF